jgi:hypothetical protein
MDANLATGHTLGHALIWKLLIENGFLSHLNCGQARKDAILRCLGQALETSAGLLTYSAGYPMESITGQRITCALAQLLCCLVFLGPANAQGRNERFGDGLDVRSIVGTSGSEPAVAAGTSRSCHALPGPTLHGPRGWRRSAVKAGVMFENLDLIGRKLHLLIEYYNGHSPNGQFFDRVVHSLGFGAHMHLH